MKITHWLFLVIVSVIHSAIGFAAAGQDLCSDLKGASLIAEDGTFLGKFKNKYSSDSIFNKYGNHGSKYSTDSIWNQYGQYGGKYSLYSPFNKYTSTPPTIYTKNQKTGKLTINNTLPHGVDPYYARSCFD